MSWPTLAQWKKHMSAIRRNNWLLRERQKGARFISVTEIPSEYPLGTEGGTHYGVFPLLPDGDEEGLHGRN